MFDNNYLLFLHLFRYKHHRNLRRTGMSGYYSAMHVQDNATHVHVLHKLNIVTT